MSRPSADIIMYRGIERIWVKEYRHDDLSWIGYTHPIDRHNTYVELNAFNLDAIVKAKIPLGEHAMKIYKHMFAIRSSFAPDIKTKKPLRQFQVEGVVYIHAKRGRVLLADEMGLGKTMQIIGTLTAYPERYLPIIILCPAHLKENWYDELGDFWTNKNAYICYGTTPQVIPPNKDVIIVNPQILKYWEDELLKQGARWLVIDEAQNFVSTKTITYEVVSRMSQKVKRVGLITGTPLVNNVQDLWGLINLVNPYILGGWTHFIHRFDPAGAFDFKKVQRFQKKKRNVWGRQVSNGYDRYESPEPSNDDLLLLHRILAQTVMIRRMKKDVWEQLPKKCRKVIRIKVTDRAFWKAEQELRESIKVALKQKDVRGESVIDMHSYSRMRQIVGNAKYEHVCTYIEEFLSESTGKLVVTGWHKDVLNKLHARFPESYLITGDIDSRKKHLLEKQFQSDSGHRLLFGNIKSIGSGINLTASDTMLFVEFPFTGADLSQVEDRIHRLSQKAKKVMYVYFLIDKSLEDDLLKYISRKQRLSAKVIDNTKAITLEDIANDAPDTTALRGLLLG